MSKRREMEHRLRSLGEIKDIMGAMKNLSLIELRKLTRFMGAHRNVVASLEAAAADFLSFHPELAAAPARSEQVLLLVGSERGFCGDFNDVVMQAYARHRRESAAPDRLVITVGERLSSRLAADLRVIARLNGPTVAEEVGSVLVRLMETLSQRQTSRDSFPLALTALYHDDDGVTVRPLLPMPPVREEPDHWPFPPVLTLPPADFFAELVDHYLFAALHHIFYTSLMVENRRRLQHMESAIQHIGKDLAALTLKRNSIRQEEITEDIEVIMLSAEEKLQVHERFRPR